MKTFFAAVLVRWAVCVPRFQTSQDFSTCLRILGFDENSGNRVDEECQGLPAPSAYRRPSGIERFDVRRLVLGGRNCRPETAIFCLGRCTLRQLGLVMWHSATKYLLKGENYGHA
ncbi:hypothetical protein AB4Y36_39735 [Paraburkholderia sp. BR10936]|uniref:hypothetical protein n=1 Tax=Paraburkholderia sp. BR10936 TaxID=3236993 RepID=UPI0034D245AB